MLREVAASMPHLDSATTLRYARNDGVGFVRQRIFQIQPETPPVDPIGLYPSAAVLSKVTAPGCVLRNLPPPLRLCSRWRQHWSAGARKLLFMDNILIGGIFWCIPRCRVKVVCSTAS